MQIKQITTLQPKLKFLEIFYFGIISGIPFSILYTALITWLTEEGVVISVATTFATAKIPYAFKYLWAPFLDGFNAPFVGKFGPRKGWMIVLIALNMVVISCFCFVHPAHDFLLIYYLAIALGFLSASLDIIIDAYRIESFSARDQANAVAFTVLGYRIGALIISSGMLISSSYIGWNYSFVIPLLIFFVALIYLPFLVETPKNNKQARSFLFRFKESVIEPFRNLLERKNIFLIILAIILYKTGGVLTGFVSVPFYLKLGYSKVQIAMIVKFLGVFATFIGLFLGGHIVARFGLSKGMIICGTLQAVMHLSFIFLLYAPVTDLSLIIAIFIENVGSSAGSAAEVAYISNLCNKNFSATQYALFTSLASFANSMFTIRSGTLVEIVGWDMFFIIAILSSVPSLVIFSILNKK
ncbi:MAG: MFS transporter [Rickettsiaceae bacterium]|nr:MFS transporter [Rickettsiaceae bacterium]